MFGQKATTMTSPYPTQPVDPPPQPWPAYQNPAYPPAAYSEPEPVPYAQPAPFPGVYPGNATIYPPMLPEHPNAAAALVLGLVGLFFPLLSPAAWALGVKANRQARDYPTMWRAGGLATAGVVLGVIGTIMLAVGIVMFAAFLAFAVLASGTAVR